MRRIGLLGGMSWESSIEYERVINVAVRERVGGLHSADLLIRSFDFAEIESMQAAGDWDGAAEVLADAARGLEAGGAELVAVCTNTMHKVADAVEAAIDVPFLHIADATAHAIHAAGVTQVGLLGTRFTMSESFYRDRLVERHGLRVVTPSPPDQAIVDEVIYGELVRGEVREASRREYLRVIEELVRDGCQGVIAGCTEIELLVSPADVEVPFFPTARLHALAIVNAALS